MKDYKCTNCKYCDEEGLCTSNGDEECYGAAYQQGRKDERRKIMNIVDSAEDIAQAMYLLGQYIIIEELKELHK